MRLLAWILLLGGCSSTGPQTQTWEGDGKYGVGVHTYNWVDSSRPTPANGGYAGDSSRALTVDVWYPTTTAPITGEDVTRDAPAAAGPFPLVVHGHGFMDNRTGEAYLAQHLAAHGYIVAAPDFPLSNSQAMGGPTVIDLPNQPGDLSFVIDQVRATSELHVDAGPVGISGLSLGGATALLTGFHARYGDSRAGAVLSIAGVSCMFTQSFFAKSLPVLFLQGDADLIAPPEANSERSFPLAEDPRELVLLKSGSHTAFAGFATLLDGSMNYDKLGCSVLNVQAPPSFSGLGSADEGIAQDSSVCPQPCTGTPITPSLDATRQEELTKIVGLAFFDEFLRAKKSATSYLAGPLATENPEVTLKLKP